MGLRELLHGLTNPNNNDEVDYLDNENDYDLSEDQEDAPEETEENDQLDDNNRFNGVNISGPTIELKVVKPESYRNAPQIADHLIAGKTVVMNLEATNKETAKRLIDFLTGSAYAVRGDIKKVSNNTYVITPYNVAVTGDQSNRGQQADSGSDTVSAAEAFSDK